MENVVDNYLDMLSFINEGEIIIGEGFVDIVKKFDPRKLKSIIPNIQSAYKDSDFNKLFKIVKTMSPEEIPIEKIEKLAEEKVPSYKTTTTLANRVLKNTFPKANSKLVKALSIAISVKSSKSENPVAETKTMLKKIAFKINNDLEKISDEDKLKIPEGTLIDEVIGWSVVGVCLLLFSAVTIGSVMTIGLGWTFGILLLIFGTYYIYNYQKVEEKRQKAEKEKP